MQTMEVERGVQVHVDMETEEGVVLNEDLQLPSLECDTTCPKWYQATFLALQHCVVMVGTIVMVSSNVLLIGGTNVEQMIMIQHMIFVAALNTLLHMFLGTRLPVIVGTTSTAYLVTLASLDTSNRMSDSDDHPEKFKKYMRDVQGALIFASILQCLTGFSGLWGFFTSYLSPLSVVPLFSFVGIGLYTLGFPKIIGCVEFGFPALVVMLILTHYPPQCIRSRRLEKFGLMTSVFIFWGIAAIFTGRGFFKKSPSKKLCKTNEFDLISVAPGFHFPRPFPWGMPSFDALHFYSLVAASLVSNIESTAAFIAASRFGETTPIPPKALGHGVGWLGIGALINGLYGTIAGPAVSLENVGLLALTRVENQRVIQITTAFMVFFSVFGKCGAILASIPLGILAPIYCVLYAYVASTCFGFQKFCDLNSHRPVFILSFSVIMGNVVPQYFAEVFGEGGEFHSMQDNVFIKMMQLICSSSTTIAVVIAYLLDLTLSHHNNSTRRHNERRWWEKFTKVNQNTISQQLYSP